MSIWLTLPPTNDSIGPKSGPIAVFGGCREGLKRPLTSSGADGNRTRDLLHAILNFTTGHYTNNVP